MSELRDELRRKWREAADTARAGYEWRGVALEVAGPIRFIASVREPDERIALLLEAPLEAAPVRHYRVTADGMSVTDQRQPEERIFRIAVVLEQEGLRDVFEVLAADVVDVATRASTPKVAISEAIRRLDAWRACLNVRRLGLSTEGQLGLIGELIVLRMLGAELGYPAAIHAWQGPLQGIHDFNLGGVAIEVKTVVGAGNWLHISHFVQLETKVGISVLALARPRLQESLNGTSLADTVKEIRDEIHSIPAALAEFNEKIIRAGYLEIDSAMYTSFRCMLQDLCWFKVAPGFPRLTAATIPAGIVDGTYTIDERSISAFRIDARSVRELILPMKEALHA
jgi:Putative  PD-(D/E)XK family member, (DUF4420)